MCAQDRMECVSEQMALIGRGIDRCCFSQFTLNYPPHGFLTSALLSGSAWSSTDGPILL